jgi:hypothetical protein
MTLQISCTEHPSEARERLSAWIKPLQKRILFLQPSMVFRLTRVPLLPIQYQTGSISSKANIITAEYLQRWNTTSICGGHRD